MLANFGFIIWLLLKFVISFRADKFFWACLRVVVASNLIPALVKLLFKALPLTGVLDLLLFVDFLELLPHDEFPNDFIDLLLDLLVLRPRRGVLNDFLEDLDDRLTFFLDLDFEDLFET